MLDLLSKKGRREATTWDLLPRSIELAKKFTQNFLEDVMEKPEQIFDQSNTSSKMFGSLQINESSLIRSLFWGGGWIVLLGYGGDNHIVLSRDSQEP